MRCIYLFKLLFSFSLAIYSEVKLLNHTVALFLVLWGNAVLHTLVAALIYNLHSHQQCMRIPLFPHSCQHLLFVDFLIIDILTGLRCYLIVVFICMSLMINDVEHFFMCLLVICISSWKKMSILVFSPFKKLGGFIFWFELFICFEYKLFIGHIICKYFLPFNRLSFHFVDGFLCCTKAFKFN